MKRTALVLVIALLQIGSAQETTIPLVVISPHDAPVMLSGNIVVLKKSAGNNFRYKARVSATNVSGKSILLIVTRVETSSETEGTNALNAVNDYFFGSKVFAPDSIETFGGTVPATMASEGKSETASQIPSATAKVSFIQYSDGATWGDGATGKELLHQRRIAWEKLKSLEDIYRTKGEHAFREELVKPSDLATPAIDILQNLYRNNDLEPVLKKLNEMLENGDQHARSMAG